MRLWQLYLLSAVIVVADQASKITAESALQSVGQIQVFSWFNWSLAYNTGAAWSFLSDAGGWQRWFFIILTVVVSIALIVWIARCWKSERLLAFSLALVLGGAIGNLIDRALYGHVIDFIQWHYGGYYFPTFNVADMAISVGAALMLICSFFDVKQPTTQSE